MRARMLVAGLVVGSCALATVAGCGGGEPASAPKPKVTPVSIAPKPLAYGAKVKVAGIRANYHGTKDVRKARSVYVEIEDFYFSPTIIRGRPRQKITLLVENESQTPHTFTTSDKTLDVQLQPGSLAKLAFTLPAHGNVSFYSTGHQQQGMAGGLTVSGSFAAPAPTPSKAQ
ncbi:cupredoxin domain-containing protein [Actinopolymorpha rutila]|uniref:Plastocyanin n=1 Tax=Actinopolymorpha rutila TaxID=446787 RepID=A0A852ZUY7_9ACTN|nr:cupredoxin domain-containing protein [Actinopolymorpha rutila]NYH93139.1 plastocyanin [Actinopolymorpha rutila]